MKYHVTPLIYLLNGLPSVANKRSYILWIFADKTRTCSERSAKLFVPLPESASMELVESMLFLAVVTEDVEAKVSGEVECPPSEPSEVPIELEEPVVVVNPVPSL